MGLFEHAANMGSGFRLSEGYRAPASLGLTMAKSVIGRVVNQRMDIDSRISEVPLHDATLGANALKRGRIKDDEILTHLGEAMIAVAIVRADESPVVPDTIVQKVVDIANNNAINLRDNPLIGEASVAQVAEIIERSS